MADFSSLKQTIQSYIKQNGNEEITGNILQDVLLAMVTTMGDSAINGLVSALQDEIAERQNQDGILQGNITAEATARRDADTALGGRIDGLQTAINGINTKLAEGYIYAGIATPSTNPGTPSGKVFYIAVSSGTYTNFSNLTAAQGINILKYNGSAWSKDVVYAIDARPKKNSQNLVTSGGIFDNMGALDVSELNATENPHTLAQYADLSAALAAIPTDYQKGGMSIKFVQSSDNTYVQYFLTKDEWSTSVGDWEKMNLEDEVSDSCNETSDSLLNAILGGYALTEYGNYYVSDTGVLTALPAQTSYICQVAKGSKIALKSNDVSQITKFRFGFFKGKPKVGDTADYYEHINVSSGSAYSYSYNVSDSGYIIIGCIPYSGMELSISNVPIIDEYFSDDIKFVNYWKGSIGAHFDIPMVSGYYKLSGQSIGSIIDETIYQAGTYKCTRYACKEGNMVKLNLTAGSTAGCYAITDSNKRILSIYNVETDTTLSDYIVICPKDSAFIYFSDKSGSKSYIGVDKIEKANYINHFELSGTVAYNTMITGHTNYTRKNISMYAQVAFTGSVNVIMGLGRSSYRGMWFQINSTEIKVFWDESGQVLVDTYQHGLTLSDKLFFAFERGIDSCVIRLICSGQVFSQNIESIGFHGGGPAFVLNWGTNDITATVSVFLRDIESPIWLIGDSYLSFNDSARWTYYMLQWEHDKWLSDSLPGANSTTMIAAFEGDIKIGNPKIALWAAGMNDSSDVDENTPEPTWLQNTKTFISICLNSNIIPLLSTIPSVPSKSHEGKNLWIKNSGLRYVDFAAAVDAQADGTWGSGYLSTDNIHPTPAGAKMLASRALIDMPEISNS